MNLIKGHGPESARIMLIDDSASAEDVNTGHAISGTGAKTLNGLFRNFDISVEECYRTLFLKTRLPYNGSKIREFEAGVTQTIEALRRAGIDHEKIIANEINSIAPNIIVPLGDLSLYHLTGFKSVYKYRGSILPLRSDIQQNIKYPVKVIPTFGPGLINANWTSRSYIVIDIGKIAKYKDFFGEVKPDGHLWVCKSAEDFGNYLARQEWRDNFLIFDIEVLGIHKEGYLGIPSCISFSLSDTEAVCVPLLDEGIDYANRILLWQKVAKLLASSVPKVNQNIKYDWTQMERFKFRVNNVTGDDTQILAGLIYPELPKNLGFLTSIYTEMPYHKDEGKNEKDRNKVYLYCAKDSLATRRVYKQQLEEIKEFGLEELYCKMKKLFFIYKKIDDRGLLVDEQQRQKLLAKYTVLMHIHERVLQDLVGHPINPRSPQQMQKLVFEELGYPQRAELNEDTIEELVTIEVKRPDAFIILKECIYIRKIKKILEYLNTVLHPDNRWRANYNLSGTENGRTSCSKSLDMLFELFEGIVYLENAGKSLQTITKHGFRIGDEVIGTDVRSIFVPTPGYILVEADLSQAEARVDAVLSTDYDLLDKFENPGIHKLTGSWLYGCEPQDIKKGTLEYHMSKIFRHAGERNIGAKTLSLTTHKTVRECDGLLIRFHQFQPNVRGVFHRDVIKFVQEHRCLVTPHTRRRDFFARPDSNMYNEAISFYPQAIVGDQNKFSFIPISEKFGDEVRYLNEAHDSSLVEIKKELLEPYAKAVKEHIEVPIDFRKGSLKRDFELVIPSEVSWSETCWHEKEMKVIKVQ